MNLFHASRLPRLGASREVASEAGTRLRGYPYTTSADSRVRVAGSRFPKNRRILMAFGRVPITGVRTNRRGSFVKRFKVPLLAPGAHRIRARAGSRRLALGFLVTIDPLIAAAGDIACDAEDPQFNGTAGTVAGCHMRHTSDLILALRPQVVLAVGDTQYEAGTPADFRLSYDLTWGRFKSITRPVIGNHEYGHRAGAGYWDYFGPLAGARPGGYYSYDVGSWHLIALNSQCEQPTVPCGPGSAQEQWLRADLAAHQNRCVLAYWHAPLFTSGGEDPELRTGPFFDALHAAGADVLLVAHAHNYERFAPQAPGGRFDPVRGIRQFVVGTGGRDLQGFKRGIAPNSEVRNADTYGVLTLRLRPGSYEWRFVPESGQTFSDAGSQACH